MNILDSSVDGRSGPAGTVWGEQPFPVASPGRLHHRIKRKVLNPGERATFRGSGSLFSFVNYTLK